MSTLVIDTIQGKTTAGSVNVRGEGSNNTNLQQGLAKQWLYYNQVASTVKDSFNVSSIVDGAAGRHSISLTSAYTGIDNYIALGYGNAYNGDSWNGNNTTATKVNWAFTNTTSLYDYTNHASGGYVDGTYAYAVSFGDLA